MEKFPIEPTFDHIIIEKIEEKTSPGGVLLPQLKDRAKEGVVVAAGPGWYIDGKLIAAGFEPGDRVYIKEFGFRINFRGKDYYVFKAGDIVGKIVG